MSETYTTNCCNVYGSVVVTEAPLVSGLKE